MPAFRQGEEHRDVEIEELAELRAHADPHNAWRQELEHQEKSIRRFCQIADYAVSLGRGLLWGADLRILYEINRRQPSEDSRGLVALLPDSSIGSRTA